MKHSYGRFVYSEGPGNASTTQEEIDVQGQVPEDAVEDWLEKNQFQDSTDEPNVEAFEMSLANSFGDRDLDQKSIETLHKKYPNVMNKVKEEAVTRGNCCYIDCARLLAARVADALTIEGATNVRVFQNESVYDERSYTVTASSLGRGIDSNSFASFLAEELSSSSAREKFGYYFDEQKDSDNWTMTCLNEDALSQLSIDLTDMWINYILKIKVTNCKY